MSERTDSARDEPVFGVVGHMGAVLGLAFCVLITAAVPLVLQLPLLVTLVVAIGAGVGLRLRKGLNNSLLAIGLCLVVVFFEPFVFFGGPIFYASLVLFPLGVALIGLVTGGRLRWALERIAG